MIDTIHMFVMTYYHKKRDFGYISSVIALYCQSVLYILKSHRKLYVDREILAHIVYTIVTYSAYVTLILTLCISNSFVNFSHVRLFFTTIRAFAGPTNILLKLLQAL